MTSPAVEARGLCCSAGGREILSGVSFTAAPGEFMAVIGPNGAGKSTLLKTLGGLIKDHKGGAFIEGADTRDLSARDTARRIAWLHQESCGAPEFTPRQFALMSRYPWRPLLASETQADASCVEAALEAAGVTPFADRPLASLSGGERQLAMLAAAAAQETDILFLDEPAGALDYGRLADAEALIGKLHKEGKTILMVTHDINEALRCADTVLALRGGRALWKADAGALTDGEKLSRLYDTEFEFFRKDGQTRPYAVPKCLVR